MNKELLSSLLEVGKHWSTGKRNYAFETRLCMPLSEFNYPQGGIVVIIDVQGFYRDERWEDAIKLHHEEVFTTPELLDVNLTQQQIDACASSFLQKLEKYTQKAYGAFKEILEKEAPKGKVYTSDIYWIG